MLDGAKVREEESVPSYFFARGSQTGRMVAPEEERAMWVRYHRANAVLQHYERRDVIGRSRIFAEAEFLRASQDLWRRALERGVALRAPPPRTPMLGESDSEARALAGTRPPPR